MNKDVKEKILEQLSQLDKQEMEYNILNNRCIIWTPKKVKKRRKK